MTFYLRFLMHFARPIIGGFLSRPADRFPQYFGRSAFLKEYPYFLACAVPATFSACAWVVSCMFLKEVRLIHKMWSWFADWSRIRLCSRRVRSIAPSGPG